MIRYNCASSVWVYTADLFARRGSTPNPFDISGAAGDELSV